MAEESTGQVQDEGAAGAADEPSQEELREARNLGWAPKDKWRGAPEEWLDARTFLERGKTFIPHLKAKSAQLEEELRQRDERDARMAAELRQTQAALQALEEAHEDSQTEDAEAAIASLRTQIAEASRDGEHELVAELTDKLVDLKTDLKLKGQGKGEKGGNGADTTAGQIPPELVRDMRGWFDKNPEYKQGRKAALANAVIDELRQKGDRRLGSEILEAAKEEVEAVLGASPGAGSSKVSGGNGGTGRAGSGAGTGGKTFADLPADAKAYCERAASRFVGEGKRYKDVAAWRASYAKQYWAQEK